MEAQLILLQTLPYNVEIWRDSSAGIDVDGGMLSNRTFKWRDVQDTLACFLADGPPTEATEETLGECPSGCSLEDWYMYFKTQQLNNRDDGVRCLRLIDDVVEKYLVTIFLAAVHVTADHNTGSEPANRPLFRFRLSAYGRTLFREMKWMLDPTNPIETVRCSDIIELFGWYGAAKE